MAGTAVAKSEERPSSSRFQFDFFQVSRLKALLLVGVLLDDWAIGHRDAVARRCGLARYILPAGRPEARIGLNCGGDPFSDSADGDKFLHAFAGLHFACVDVAAGIGHGKVHP
jgi:hypothetical protein